MSARTSASASGSVLSLRVEQLENDARFPRQRLTCALQCTGNRLDELARYRETGFGASAGSKGYIGNAEWGGVLLRDVLSAAGVAHSADDEPDGRHVELEGADGFCLSVPLRLVLDPARPVLLATRMNGEPLPADHGAPVRALVVGAPGARSVKWLTRVSVIDGESRSPWQRSSYRDERGPIYEWPVQGIITSHNSGDCAELGAGGHVRCHGVAYSGGGRGIARVDVSADEGKSWHAASLRPSPRTAGGQWGWTTWSAAVPVHPGGTGRRGGGVVELRCRATDESGAVQPKSVADVWTPRGYCCNSEHAVHVRVPALAGANASA
eukprot:g4834.t1